MPEFASSRNARVLGSIIPLYQFIFESKAGRQLDDPDASNFAFGNPHEMPLQGFVDALQKWSIPQSKDWYAYPDTIFSAKETVMTTLREIQIPVRAR